MCFHSSQASQNFQREINFKIREIKRKCTKKHTHTHTHKTPLTHIGTKTRKWNQKRKEWEKGKKEKREGGRKEEKGKEKGENQRMVNLKALAGSHPGCAAASPSSPQEMSCYWMTVSSTSPQCPHPSPPPSATLLIKKPASLCDPFGSHVPSLGRVQGKWTLHSDVAFECNYSILSAPWFGVTPLPAAPEPQDPQASSASIAAPCHQFPVAPDPLILPLSTRSSLLRLSWTWQSGPCSLLWPVILTLWKTLLLKIILSSSACSWNTVEHSL